MVIFGLFILLLALNPKLSCFGKRIASPFYPLARKRRLMKKAGEAGKTGGGRRRERTPEKNRGLRFPSGLKVRPIPAERETLRARTVEMSLRALRVSGIAFFVLVALQACVSGPPVLSPPPARIDAMDGYGSLSLRRESGSVKTRFSFRFILPDTARIEALDVFGRMLAVLIFKEGDSWLSPPFAARLLDGPRGGADGEVPGLRAQGRRAGPPPLRALDRARRVRESSTGTSGGTSSAGSRTDSASRSASSSAEHPSPARSPSPGTGGSGRVRVLKIQFNRPPRGDLFGRVRPERAGTEDLAGDRRLCSKMKIRSFAKINLGLEILGKRPDGYHDIRTLFQSIDLADDLEFEPATDGRDIRLSRRRSGRPLGREEPRPSSRRAPPGARRAKAAGSGSDVTKSIPPGKGLGGGSGNAAMTLFGLNILWDLDLGKIGPGRARPEASGRTSPISSKAVSASARTRGDRLTPLAGSSARCFACWPSLLSPSRRPGFTRPGVPP